MYKVFVLGVLPPPVGGVSIHVSRFVDFCQDSTDEFKVALFDYKKNQFFLDGMRKSWAGMILFLVSANIIHIHVSSSVKVIFALLAKLMRKKVVYTHHNSLVGNSVAFKLIVMLSDTVILVNSEKIKQHLDLNGADNKIVEIPAFIPASRSHSLPEQLTDKIFGYTSVISVNCSSNKQISGEEVYGISRLVRVFEKMAEEKFIENFVLLVCDPSGSYREQIDWGGLSELKFGNGIIYWGDMVDFTEVIKLSACTVRPTITDGDSISVRESIYFGVHVVASDCVRRPLGTVTYKTLDDDDLMEKILKVVSGAFGNPDKGAGNYAHDVLEAYRKLMV